MKQNITLSLDKQILKRPRAFAAERGTSVSAMLAAQLRNLIERAAEYSMAKVKALSLLDSPFHLGGRRTADRQDLHERKRFR
jgi:hypothetical protein